MAVAPDATPAISPSVARRHPGWFAQTLSIVRKDLAIELRSGEVITTSGFFAVLIVVMASMAFWGGPVTGRRVAAGALWLSVAFAAVLAISRTWSRERDENVLVGLLVSPLKRSALFAGKALGVTVFLGIIEVIVMPLATLFFGIDLADTWLGLLVIGLLATPGIAAAGTLFGAMTVRTRARDLVLAVVLFPLLSPTLLSAVVATRELFNGAALDELTDFLQLMAVFDAVFVAGGVGLFGTLIQD